ncbi:DsbA family protein [Ktedonobacter racemifer]|uniref:DSBA oxidoreductase n=1 Tax=Ktedonobacter racemifer DSM 44963 TaxID=485913 RepID=D6U416_KTERA|nr:DsbA family protein [Ktedonobacter racemifer]EFH81254.1 hypothetical protein Krac_1960 [Ktedonobacter racemifer DSM 44963]
MTQPLRIACYSDLHCPYAYVNAYRLRQLRTEYAGQIEIVYKSRALEYRNNQPTPKGILDNETAALMLEEPEIPYQPGTPLSMSGQSPCGQPLKPSNARSARGCTSPPS